jgi:hypothetical protein
VYDDLLRSCARQLHSRKIAAQLDKRRLAIFMVLCEDSFLLRGFLYKSEEGRPYKLAIQQPKCKTTTFDSGDSTSVTWLTRNLCSIAMDWPLVVLWKETKLKIMRVVMRSRNYLPVEMDQRKIDPGRSLYCVHDVIGTEFSETENVLNRGLKWINGNQSREVIEYPRTWNRM